MKVLAFVLTLLTILDYSNGNPINKRVWYTEKLRMTTQDPLEVQRNGLRDLKRQLLEDTYIDGGGWSKIKFAQYLIKDTLIKLLGLMHPESKLEGNVKRS